MIEHYLSTSWNVAAPAIGNHLWQSTLVALAAGVLTLAVRRHNAHIRYFLWLAASVKFLIPFSFLISLGQLFAWRSSGPALQRATVLYAVEEIGQPFTRTATQVASPHVSGAPAVSVHWLPWLGLAWLAGFIAVLLLWIVRWHRISAQMKSAEQCLLEDASWRFFAASSVSEVCANPLGCCSPAIRSNPASSASSARSCSGRREFPSISTTSSSRPFSPTKSGMSAAVTISSLRCTCSWKPSSGSIPRSGGSARAWWTSVNDLAMKKSLPPAATARSMPKAF